jgi:hypothetical protein
MENLVYRSGSARDDNLTPRPGKDTVGKPGQAPGLSTFRMLELAVEPGDRVQVIDLDRLENPLHAYEDQPGLEGAMDGHVSIAPARPDGRIDQELLAEWSATRNTNATHWLTKLMKNAIVETIKRPR